ncbi:MAG: DUF91 domain-containing protein [Desulfomonile tiedjei]|nr:DUF91 domain-containing protein [Desulfomonile tiedjei]
MKKREPTGNQISSWHKEIEKSGIKRLKARILLKSFGYERRGKAAISSILEWMAGQDPPIYVYGLEHARWIDDPVGLSYVEQQQIGSLAKKEKDLMDRFEADIMPILRLRTPDRHYSPPGCRDKLDFLCKDTRGRAVVVEIKKGSGEKRVVEQVLQYIRLVRNDPSHKDPRGIIITGFADFPTRHALEELEPDYHIDWFIYGLAEDLSIQLQQIKIQSLRA